jgi:hypothetical protein
MERGELLVPAAECELLRVLDEPTRPFRVFFDVHRFNSPFSGTPPRPKPAQGQTPEALDFSEGPARRAAPVPSIEEYVGAIAQRKRPGAMARSF